MTEELRDLLLERFASVYSGYGATDIEIGMAGESPVSIAVRRLARARPDIRRALFGDRLTAADGLPVQPAHPLPRGQRRRRGDLHRQPARPAGAADPLQRPRRGRDRRLRRRRTGARRVRLRPGGAQRAAEVARPARTAAVGEADPAAVRLDPRPARRDDQRHGLEHLPRGHRGGPVPRYELVAPRLHSFMLSVVDDENGTPRPSVALELSDLDGRRRRLAARGRRAAARRARGAQHRLPLVVA